MGLIPESGAKNEKGEYIDVLKNIQAKKEIAGSLLPLLWNFVKQAEALGHVDKDNEQLIEAKKRLQQVADSMNIDLN